MESYSEDEILAVARLGAWTGTEMVRMLKENREKKQVPLPGSDGALSAHMTADHGLLPKLIARGEHEMSHALAHMRGQFTQGREHIH